VSTTLPALPAFRSRVVPVAQALLAGGIDVIEITLRTPCALDAIAAVAREVPDMQVGAGTLLSADDVRRAQDAGARFGLSPGHTPALLRAVAEAGLPFVPGVMTPGEVMTAREAGYRLMKLFPATVAGGLDMLKALASPFGDVRFCPTGGVSLDNLGGFLKQPNVALVGGSWLAPAAALQAGDWAQITTLARQAMALSAG